MLRKASAWKALDRVSASNYKMLSIIRGTLVSLPRPQSPGGKATITNKGALLAQEGSNPRFSENFFFENPNSIESCLCVCVCVPYLTMGDENKMVYK